MILLIAPIKGWTKEQQPCDPQLISSLAKQLKQEHWVVPTGEQNNPLIAAACKVWVEDDSQSVVALAYLEPGNKAPVGEREFHLLVGKVNNQDGLLLESYQELMAEDAMLEIGGSSLWLDTARYHLAPGIRAFGLVLTSVGRGASSPTAWADGLLTLYVPDNGKLRSVFSTYLDLSVYCSSDNGVPPNADCDTGFADVTLGIGPKQSHGFADLIVTVNWRTDGNTKVKQTVHYDGQRYPFPNWIDLMSKPWDPTQSGEAISKSK
ncbi:hypothetical protein [Serratia sp. DD3]|uniref:hypothetical protein n=1 Tax=Serratia sp. DD3 TaxID=1410619 RepID=UPI00041C8693|nr:hypothetical protein [Serratia sp. DD3]